MCIAHRLLLSTSEISDATASMPSPGYFALQHRVAPPRKAYSLTRRLSSHSAHYTHFPFSNQFLEVPIIKYPYLFIIGSAVLPDKRMVRFSVIYSFITIIQRRSYTHFLPLIIPD